MSNSEETENKATETPEKTPTETPAPEAAAPEKPVNKLLENAMGLKESNPKVFFGAIGGLVILVLIVIMSSGSKNTVPTTTLKTLTIGQQYSLKGANSLGGNGSISMVASPDSVMAFDDSEEKGVESPCKQQPEGTAVKVLALSDYVGKKNGIAQIEVLSKGNCQGRKGWTLVVDIQ
ncbi:MAG: hypothetical protein KAG10_11240 [Methylococcales bacterium]|nr:hypothetical protein [Methylococcales bacterium]MCK5926462.1 hypothetical protein [Methylococcales bacterium]